MKLKKISIIFTLFYLFFFSCPTSAKNNQKSNLDLKTLKLQGYQIFEKDNFVINQKSKFRLNYVLMNMAKKQGNKLPITSYISTEHKDSYVKAVICTIQISDISADYKNLSLNKQNEYTVKFLNNYCSSLKANNMSYKKVNFIGLNSVEYSFLQNCSLPTNAIIFIKDKKAFLLQVGTRKNLSKKYSDLKKSFKFIK